MQYVSFDIFFIISAFLIVMKYENYVANIWIFNP